LHDKLGELEEKIRMLLTEVSQSRQEKKNLAASVRELEAKLASVKEQLDLERAEKEQLELQLKQRGEEREEIRAKVEGILAEVSRIEANFSELS